MSGGLWRVGEEECEYVRRAVAEGLTGKYTRLFEERFAALFDLPYAVAVNSGTSALHAALAAMGIGPGDEVIVPPLTFAATAFAVLYLGAVPVFADVDEETFMLTAETIAARITPRTRAVIPVSLYGAPPPLDEITDLARRRGLRVLEDDAQCVLGRRRGRLVGTWGDAAVFSLQRSKHLTTGDGGVILTGDAGIAERARKFADLGYRQLTAAPISNEDFKERLQVPGYRRHASMGYNYRMPEVCAAMGLAQLEKAEDLVARRIACGRLYAEAVEGIPGVVPQRVPEDAEPTYWTFAFRLDEEAAGFSRETFRRAFREAGGESFYAAWELTYLEPALEGMRFPEHGLRYERGLCPTAERIQPQLVQLKTNFRTVEAARRQADLLGRTLRAPGGG